MQAGDQPADVHRVEARIRVGELHPGMEPDSRPAAAGDALARPRASHRGRGVAGGERRLLEGGGVEQLGEVLAGDVIDLLDRPAAALEWAASPDGAEPPARDRSVRD